MANSVICENPMRYPILDIRSQHSRRSHWPEVPNPRITEWLYAENFSPDFFQMFSTFLTVLQPAFCAFLHVDKGHFITESESLSQNVRLGIKFRNEQGKIQVNHNWFLGYTKDEEGNLIIDEEQAEVVRRIYRDFLDGKTERQIVIALEAEGIKNGAGHTKWQKSNIHQILTNEKYIGDALLQNTVMK